MNFYDEDLFWRRALPRSIACGDWCVPLLLDERVDLVFCVKTISLVIMFI
jgi:hypothetical protein